MVIGWNAYYVNRYRKDVVIGDLSGLLGAIGGAGVMALFDEKTVVFAFYGFGLAVGFFGYLLVLLIFVALSKVVTIDFFLGTTDGVKPMGDRADRFDPPL